MNWLAFQVQLKRVALPRRYPPWTSNPRKAMKPILNVLFLILACAPHILRADDFDLYYLGGQSNMEGFGSSAELSDDERQPVKDAWIFQSTPLPDQQPALENGLLYNPVTERASRRTVQLSNAATDSVSSLASPKLFVPNGRTEKSQSSSMLVTVRQSTRPSLCIGGAGNPILKPKPEPIATSINTTIS